MLHEIAPAPGSRKGRKRVARGNSAGGGTTAGRGTKGQQSRSGYKKNHGFEGGQTPLLMRQPKLAGFRNPKRVEFEPVNLGDIEKNLDAGSYDIAALKESHLIRTKKPVKLLSRGEVSKKFNLSVNAASKAATEAVEKAGGSVTIVSAK